MALQRPLQWGQQGGSDKRSEKATEATMLRTRYAFWVPFAFSNSNDTLRHFVSKLPEGCLE